MLRKWSGVLVLMLWTSIALAGVTTADVRRQVEASMLVNGTIDIDAQGQVTDYQLAEQASLPPALLAVVDRHVRGWRFDPMRVDGNAVRARSPMHVRLVMKRDGDRFLFRIAGATFGTTYGAGAVPTVNGTLSPPRYPEYAYTSNVGGVVYLVVKVGRDGSVEDAIAEQVNLRSLGSEHEMARFREILTDPAISVSRKWKFNFPTRGEDADKPFVLVRVAVEYLARDMPSERAGRWLPYVPGPRQPVPWRNWDAAGQQPDAITVGEAYPDNPKGPKLIGNIDG
ncbi:protein tonB [Lysobacter sp. LF1]|uniref:Protein tonB n=1 Tax=Lysobacter stagni TaxID=3045172 RepID=A0ABT6XDV9_9GAMM|nr:protein tonB [Lysobacter sp. LF1]MDI9238327.1 protein tonB [Lysobacter sp. LF1]